MSCQAWQSEVSPKNLHGRREWAPISCPLTYSRCFTCICAYKYTPTHPTPPTTQEHTHTYSTHMQKQLSKIAQDNLMLQQNHSLCQDSWEPRGTLLLSGQQCFSEGWHIQQSLCDASPAGPAMIQMSEFRPKIQGMILSSHHYLWLA